MSAAPPNDPAPEGADRTRSTRTETVGAPGSTAAGSLPGPTDAPQLSGERLAVRLGLDPAQQERARFVVDGTLGAGASGQVFSLFDRDLRRSTALKVLSWPAGADAAALDEFMQEARITASLAHPNVPPIYDVDMTSDGAPCYSMGRVQGRTLADAIDASSAAARDATIATANAVVTIFIAICRAMSYAHDRGLVHQDLKPGNVLLGEYGEVLVLDWGSAKHRDDASASQRLSGTPLYMSPEQARREYADQRSDVYCLGASLFHALFLRPPTYADDADAFWDKKRRGAIDALSEAEAAPIPAPLASIALTALRPEPSARYASAAAMAADLERFQAGLAVSVHREPLWMLLRRWYRGNRRFFWTVCLAAAAIAALGGAFTRERALRSARWEPVAGDPFAAPLDHAWKLRSRYWTEHRMRDAPLDEPSGLRRDGDALVLSGTNPTDLSYKAPLLGGIRVEWSYTPTPKAENLNCFIEGDSRDTSYAFHIAALGDQAGAFLTRGDPPLVLEHARLAAPLVVGQTYHFAMEKQGDSVRLSIDGRQLIDYEDPDPEAPSAGTFGFDACNGSANRIADLRIWHLPLAQRITPVAYARNLLQLGQYDLAYAQFADIYATYGGEALAPEALYGMAVSRARQGRDDEAIGLLERFLADYPRHAMIPGCLRERIAIARARGDDGALERSIAALQGYRGHPLVKAVAAQLARDEISAIGEKQATAAGEERFPDDAVDRLERATARTRRWLGMLGVGLDQTSFPTAASTILAQLGRNDLIVELLSDQPDLCADALNRMGRYDEVLSRYPSSPGTRARALLCSGRYAEVLAGPFPDMARMFAAVAEDGPAKALALFPNEPELLIAQGRFDEALAAAPNDAVVHAKVLEAQGRFEEALPFARADWMRCLLLLRLGRFQEAEPVLAADPALRYWYAQQLIYGGHEADGRALLGLLARLRHPPLDYEAVAFPYFFLPVLLANRDGQAIDPSLAWRDLLQEYRWCDGQWPWHMAALISGRIDEAAFRAQPHRLGLERRLHLSLGMKAEFAHDWAGAADQYRACLALPIDQLGDFINTQGGDYVRWRLPELARIPAPTRGQ